MKQIWIGLVSGVLILSACRQLPAGEKPAGTATPVLVTRAVTATLSPMPTGTNTLIPTVTPTASITPLPTIPTFTPTFDVSTIVTVTPAPMAECATKGDASLINFAVYPSGQKYVGHPTIDEILRFLNSGGKLEQLIKELKQVDANYAFEDLTNDEASDLVIISGSFVQMVNILWCQNGKYKLFPPDSAKSGTLLSEQVDFSIQDLNQNGVPDVLSIGDGRALNVNVLEWNGTEFHDLTMDETKINAWMAYASSDDFQIRDVNKDGIIELILKGLPYHLDDPGAPSRSRADIYYWNGKTYSAKATFGAPHYSFQAVQDGDLQVFQGNYQEATNLYQLAIDSDQLDWWSRKRFEQNREAAINFTTPAQLTPDETEYPRLAAYAYYRIMLLYIVQRHESDAGTVYKTLQQKFGSDPYARLYVEMATAFWNAYQSTHKMYDGCAAAIQYAAEHPEILVPLGSDYHGWQSHIYVPADVCPFR